jgi:4-amino-4-deoxy-L-arabinose transferase-like glycosyltransferase
LLFEPDEGRYAEIPREMLARGEWIVPYLQGEPYLDKPPLFYWLVMASYRLLGVHDWSARVVPALAVHACVFLTYFLGRRWLGERAAFWGALTLALAPGFVSVGRLLVLDGLLALWVTLSLFAGLGAVGRERLHWGWWLLAAAACGMGVLTKGPVALLLLAPPLALHRWLSPKTCRINWSAMIAFAAVLLALALPWYVAVCLRLPEFASYFLWKHNVLRFLSPFDHQEPVWFYLPIVLGGLLPASLLAVAFLRFLGSGNPAMAEKRPLVLGYLLLAGSWCFFFFTMSGSKLVTYVLPAFPPLALALGYYVSVSGWERSIWTRAVPCITVCLLALLHYLGVPWYARFHSPMSQGDKVARFCADPQTPVVCYPRNCDSVAFYLGRDDLRSYRSKEVGALLGFLQDQTRTVVLFTHRHAPGSLKHFLPPRGLQLTDLTPISQNWANALRIEDCLMGVVEKQIQQR